MLWIRSLICYTRSIRAKLAVSNRICTQWHWHSLLTILSTGSDSNVTSIATSKAALVRHLLRRFAWRVLIWSRSPRLLGSLDAPCMHPCAPNFTPSSCHSGHCSCGPPPISIQHRPTSDADVFSGAGQVKLLQPTKSCPRPRATQSVLSFYCKRPSRTDGPQYYTAGLCS